MALLLFVCSSATYTVTNNPEPALTPSVPGEARSLCSKSCMTTPDIPMPRPTRIARQSLGRRYSNNARRELSSPPPKSVSNTFPMLMRYWPTLHPKKKTMSKSPAKTIFITVPRSIGDFSFFIKPIFISVLSSSERISALSAGHEDKERYAYHSDQDTDRKFKRRNHNAGNEIYHYDE